MGVPVSNCKSAPADRRFTFLNRWLPEFFSACASSTSKLGASFFISCMTRGKSSRKMACDMMVQRSAPSFMARRCVGVPQYSKTPPLGSIRRSHLPHCGIRMGGTMTNCVWCPLIKAWTVEHTVLPTPTS